MMKKIIVIGNGIASTLFVYFLSQRVKEKIEVLSLADDDLFPRCTLKSTSLVAKRGAKKGTPLGDLLTNSFDEVESFFSFWKNKYQSIQRVEVTSLCQKGSKFEEDYLRRFLNQVKDENDFLEFKEWGYLFDAKKILEDLEQEIVSSENILWKKEKEAVVRSFFCSEKEKYTLQCLSGKEIEGKYLFFGTNAYSSLLLDYPLKSEVITGHYLKFQSCNLGDKSFVYNLHEKTFTYRAEENSIEIGVVSTKGFNASLKEDQLKEIYSLFKPIFSKNIPPLEKGEVLFGYRHKIMGRRPGLFIDKKVNQSILMASLGTYKNGFSYNFVLAKEAVDEIMNHWAEVL